MKKKSVKILLIIIIILVLVGALLFYKFYYKTCEDQACFDSALEGCSRVKFLSHTEDDMLFEYRIKGKWRDACKVSVKFVRGDMSNQDSLRLEGKTMWCSLPLGEVLAPEKQLDVCHGRLKEKIQDIVIDKLNTYIVGNIKEN